MRKFVLGASLVAAFATPAVAQPHRHTRAPDRSSDFMAVAPEGSTGPRFGLPSSVSSPNLSANPHPCVWGVACSY